MNSADFLTVLLSEFPALTPPAGRGMSLFCGQTRLATPQTHPAEQLVHQEVLPPPPPKVLTPSFVVDRKPMPVSDACTHSRSSTDHEVLSPTFPQSAPAPFPGG